jgi:uncharacterized protein
MIGDAFEWDDDKALANFAKHGVTFGMARTALLDPFVFEEIDRRQDYGEERFLAVGMHEDRLISVAFTIRNERMRIISARKAEPRDKRKYHERKSQED